MNIIGVTVGTSMSPAKIADKMTIPRIYKAQKAQEDGAFAFEQGKSYMIYSPKVDGVFACEIAVNGFAPDDGANGLPIKIQLPAIDSAVNADSFIFELIEATTFTNTSGQGWITTSASIIYTIDGHTKVYTQQIGGSEIVYNTGYISGATNVGIFTKEVFINPDGDKSVSCVPEVTEEDNGKILRVVDGEWQAVELPYAKGVSF